MTRQYGRGSLLARLHAPLVDRIFALAAYSPSVAVNEPRQRAAVLTLIARAFVDSGDELS